MLNVLSCVVSDTGGILLLRKAVIELRQFRLAVMPVVECLVKLQQ
jgi:hypothetical protein